MTIKAIVFEEREMTYSRELNAVFVEFDTLIRAGQNGFIRVYYDGQPKVAIKPPWDGGFSWEKDKDGNDWIGVSCQGLVPGLVAQQRSSV